MAPVKTVILGNGGRGRVYADYARRHPGEFRVVAVADLDGSGDFADWREALKADTGAELAIVALPDRLHCEAGIAALKRGLDVLMEKPVGCDWAECRKLRNAVKRYGRQVFPGYVLRHTAQYRKVAELLESGAIGTVHSIHHLNSMGYRKTIESFCRGQWAKTAESGPLILTKASHDLDLIAWWLRGRKLKSIVSMGEQHEFRPRNAPAGADGECDGCRAECPFKVAGEKCVYRCGADVVDYQSTLIECKAGPLVNFELEALSSRRGRFTRFFGTRGTMLVDEGKITVRQFGRDDEDIYTFQAETDHHGGGDDGLMAYIAKELNAGPEAALKRFDETLVSHYLAFKAEESRKEHRICKL